MKFCITEFYEKLSSFFGSDQQATVLTSFLYEGLRVFLHAVYLSCSCEERLFASLCPSVCLDKCGSYWTIFFLNLTLGNF